MTTEKLSNYGFLRPQDMSQTENSFTFWEVQQTYKILLEMKYVYMKKDKVVWQ